jgi:hypothetical protein
MDLKYKAGVVVVNRLMTPPEVESFIIHANEETVFYMENNVPKDIDTVASLEIPETVKKYLVEIRKDLETYEICKAIKDAIKNYQETYKYPILFKDVVLTGKPTYDMEFAKDFLIYIHLRDYKIKKTGVLEAEHWCGQL